MSSSVADWQAQVIGVDVGVDAGVEVGTGVATDIGVVVNNAIPVVVGSTEAISKSDGSQGK